MGDKLIPAGAGFLETQHSSSADNRNANQKRVERFVAKYVDSPAKAELLRILSFRPNQFQTLPEILALTRSSLADIEQAVFSLRGLGLVQLKDGPRGTAIALSYESAARKLAHALWRHLKSVEDSRRPAPNVEAQEPSPGARRSKRETEALAEGERTRR